MSALGTIVGVDVGGTFTDLVWYDERNHVLRTGKVPSNRGDEAVGFLEGLRGFGPVAELDSIVHGTTVGTNALLERKGARTGIITTAGFRDVLEMRRRDRPNTWGLWGSFVPVVERDLRLEVSERTLASGQIHTAVDPAEVTRAAQKLIELGAQSVAVIFINAYANPANEEAALAAVQAVWPNENICISTKIIPEIREFERASTTALNAYLQPGVGSYLSRLEDGLAQDGFKGSFHVVQSNGGVMSTAMARKVPIRTALSGPAAGVIAAAAIARAAGYPNIVTGDLGGTSYDVSMMANGRTSVAAQSTIDFGLVVRTPMIEITTIGAGGGSIAHVDAGGMLNVGPESAGSRPGPVCYGQGNDRPTLTDANVVLGRINADRPIGGKLKRLDVEAAREAIRIHVADPLGIEVMAAAEAIVRIAGNKMAGAIRLISIERGHDPSQFVSVPFGGGGALHVSDLIRDVGLKGALVPRYPGVASALGCVIADIRHDQVCTLNTMLEGLSCAALAQRMETEAAAAVAVIEAAGLGLERIDTRFELDMHYLGQTHTLGVELPHDCIQNGRVTITAETIATCFETAYQHHFSRLLLGLGRRIVNLRTTAIGVRPEFDLSLLAPAADADATAAQRGSRPVWFDGAWHETAIIDRLLLPVGAVVTGPAILEQPDATTVIAPDMTARIDHLGNAILERKA